MCGMAVRTHDQLPDNRSKDLSLDDLSLDDLTVSGKKPVHIHDMGNSQITEDLLTFANILFRCTVAKKLTEISIQIKECEQNTV